MKELITVLTVLILVVLIAIIFKQRSILNNLEKELSISRGLFKELYELHHKIYDLWKHK